MGYVFLTVYRLAEQRRFRALDSRSTGLGFGSHPARLECKIPERFHVNIRAFIVCKFIQNMQLYVEFFSCKIKFVQLRCWLCVSRSKIFHSIWARRKGRETGCAFLKIGFKNALMNTIRQKCHRYQNSIMDSLLRKVWLYSAVVLCWTGLVIMSWVGYSHTAISSTALGKPLTNVRLCLY